MNNSCPRCGAMYNVTEKDIGRRISCKKCSSPLTVDEDGIRVEGPDAAEPFDEGQDTEAGFEPLPKRRRATGRSRQAVQMPGWLTVSMAPTILFGAGMFFIVLFSFFPILDRASAAAAQAAILKGDLEDQKDEIETNQLDDGNPSADDLEKRRERSKDWQDEKQLLEIEAKLAEVGTDRAMIWNQRGLLFGFVVLTFAGIGYLVTEQPNSRKILGGVLLVLIFLAVTQGGLVIGMGRLEP